MRAWHATRRGTRARRCRSACGPPQTPSWCRCGAWWAAWTACCLWAKARTCTHVYRARVAPVLRCSRSMTAAQEKTGVTGKKPCCVHTKLSTAALCKKTELTPRTQRCAGAVFWAPPAEAIADAAAHAHEAPYSQYGNDEGVDELRAALHAKVAEENKLRGVRGLPHGACECGLPSLRSLPCPGPALHSSEYCKMRARRQPALLVLTCCDRAQRAGL